MLYTLSCIKTTHFLLGLFDPPERKKPLVHCVVWSQKPHQGITLTECQQMTPLGQLKKYTKLTVGTAERQIVYVLFIYRAGVSVAVKEFIRNLKSGN